MVPHALWQVVGEIPSHCRHDSGLEPLMVPLPAETGEGELIVCPGGLCLSCMSSQVFPAKPCAQFGE